MHPFVWEFKGKELPRETYAQKVWFGSRFSNLDEMEVDRERREEEEIKARVREIGREVAQEYQSRIDILREDKGILEKAMDIQRDDLQREKVQWAQERRALKAQFRQKKVITTAQQQEEREAQFKVVRDHERRGFAPLIQGLRDQIGGVESNKECQITEFEIERHNYQSMINLLEGESLEIQRQRDMALEREHDALDLAETREIRVSFYLAVHFDCSFIVIESPPPRGPSEGTSTVPLAIQPPLHATSDHILPPGYLPKYSLHAAPSTSNVRPPVAPVRNTPLVVSGAPVYTIPPPPPVTRPNNEPPSHAYDGQYYSPNMAFGVSAPYNQTPQYESPVENEKPAKMVELDEMARKMKSLEQNIMNIQGLSGHKSVSFSDLCMFPHIHLPPRFKTP
ncbi:uncharacterized protein [Nicotiana tomentosiformis]|uniref:uncharacterized protein n=1 Tax=Nicotiana tomentosiformis TaxID=4098 RepID=UPI00388CDAA2